MKQGIIRHTLLALVLSAFGAGTMAQEIEDNGSISKANELTIDSTTGSVTVTGYIGRAGSLSKFPDIDFYKFKGYEGNLVTINIDNAWRGPGTPALTSLNSVLHLFGPEPTYTLLYWNDDATPDAGSVPTVSGTNLNRDARIDAARLPVNGWYYVAVTANNMFYKDYTSLSGSAFTNGAYTLTISGVTDPIVNINIDIKPGNNELSPVNPNAKGVLPVALLGSKDFDPFKINVSSLTFGRTGEENSLRRCNDNPVDFDRDGHMDRLCHFDNEAADFNELSINATVKGKTLDNKQFKGTGRLKVVPAATPAD